MTRQQKMFWSLAVLFLFHPLALAMDVLELRVGEERVIPLPEMPKVKVSQKSVVYLSFEEGQGWRVVGLRTGFVVLTFENPEKQTRDIRFVDVQKKAPPEEPVTAPLHLHGPPRNPEAQLLSQEEQEALFLKVQSLLKDLPIGLSSVTAQGGVILERPCGGGIEGGRGDGKGSGLFFEDHEKVMAFVGKLLGGEMSEDKILLRCSGPVQLHGYELCAKVFALSEQQAQEYGLTPAVRGGWGLGSPQRLSMKGTWAYLSQDQNVTVIGEPTLSLVGAWPGESRSGGEIPFLGASVGAQDPSDWEKQTLSWKEFGLNLKARVSPLSAKRALVFFDMTLKTPGGGGGRQKGALQSHALKGVSPLFFAQPEEIVGSISLDSKGRGEESLPFLGNWPLIGPLVRSVLSQHSRSHLYLALSLKDRGPLIGEESSSL